MYIGTIFSVNKSKDDKKRWPTGYSLTEIFIQTCGTALKKKKHVALRARTQSL